MRHPVDLVLPDAGPLITLAAANRLDLLRTFGRPVKVLDVVRAECLRDPAKLAHAELNDWFNGHGSQPEIVHTPMMAAYQAALAEADRTGSPASTRGMGDATLVWFERNLPSFHQPGFTTLVMTEDSNLGDTRLRRVHVLSTRAFLGALEKAGFIESAADIITAVQQRGRRMSRYYQDRRGLDDSGDTTDWVRRMTEFRGLGGPSR